MWALLPESNTDGRYTYSEPVLAVGVDEALRQTGFDYGKFVDRGGALGPTDSESRVE